MISLLPSAAVEIYSVIIFLFLGILEWIIAQKIAITSTCTSIDELVDTWTCIAQRQINCYWSEIFMEVKSEVD